MASISDPLERQYDAQREALNKFHLEHPAATGSIRVPYAERDTRSYDLTDPFTWLADQPSHLSVSYSASKVLWSIYRQEVARHGLSGLPPNFRDEEALDIEDTALTNEQAIATARAEYDRLRELSLRRNLTDEELAVGRGHLRLLAEFKLIGEYQEHIGDQLEQLRPPVTTQEVKDTAKIASAIIGLRLR